MRIGVCELIHSFRIVTLAGKFFRALDGGAKPGEAIGMIQPTVPESIAQKVLSQQALDGSVGGGKDAIYDSVRLSTLMRLIRVRGHLESRLDPLGLQTPTKQKVD